MVKVVRYTIEEASELAGAEHGFVVHCLRAHWVVPAFPEESALDEVDVARLRLIRELVQDFGVNDEAVPVILHLLDQLHTLHEALGSSARRASGE